jgi:hypothetical protein
MIVIRELLDDEDPLSAGSPPFISEPGAGLAPPPASWGSLRLEGGRAPAAAPRSREQASRVPALPRRSLRWSSSLPPLHQLLTPKFGKESD